MHRAVFMTLATIGMMLSFSVEAEAQGGTLAVNLPVSGVFHAQLPVDGSGKPFVDYQFVVTLPGSYQIDLVSSDTAAYDPMLVVLQNGLQIAADDDGGGALNSRILQVMTPGYYSVRVTRFGAGPITRPVAYTISVTSSVAPGGITTSPQLPLTDSLARAIATRFYTTRSEWAGQYAITINQSRLIHSGPMSSVLHLQYHYSCIRSSCSGGPAGIDQRVFYFQRVGNQWQVMRMGPHMSASF